MQIGATGRIDCRPKHSAGDAAGRLAMIALIASLASCGSTAEPVNLGPAEGTWSGEELSFTLRAGVIEDLTLVKTSCTGDDGCTASYGGAIAGRWSATPKVRIEAGDLVLDGTYSNRLQVAGEIRLGADDPCCQVVGAWSASHRTPLPTAQTDAGGTNADGTLDGTVGGRPGPTDWNGNSFGDLHPGPSQAVAPTTGSATLSKRQQAAHASLLSVRAAVGAGAIVQDAALAAAAQGHADFYGAYSQQYQAKSLSPHAQDPSFGAGFTGVNATERLAKAGFTGPPGAEIIAFSGTAAGAVAGWMATVYHRLPLVSPTNQAFGYGGAKGVGVPTKAAAKLAPCEVMNFSARASRATDPTIVVPWPGQTQVDRSWSGNEGPQPPKPPGGYPSGSIITARIPGITAWGDHQLEDDKGKAIAHVFLEANNDPNMKLFDRFSMAMYSHEPLRANTQYTVRLQVTIGGKQRQLAWRFTTR